MKIFRAELLDNLEFRTVIFRAMLHEIVGCEIKSHHQGPKTVKTLNKVTYHKVEKSDLEQTLL